MLKKFFANKYLILVILLAIFIRAWQFGNVPVSLFGDELDVGYHAYSIFKTGKDYSGNSWPIHFQSLAEWRTPLYLYSAVPTVALFGITPLGVRLPALIFGIAGIIAFYFLVKELFKDERLALVASLVMALSPWHIQYSRDGFEVTELIFFLLAGLLFFFRGIKSGKYLWLAAACLALTLWVYSTAKLFTPLLVLFLFISWRKKILSLPRKYLIYAVIAGLIVGVPITYSTVFGGGGARFGYISVFSDPTTESEIGFARQVDAKMRGEKGVGVSPSLIDRFFHNKFVVWGTVITRNYFQALGSDFLFNEGDPNLRHSINGIGQFYKLESIPLVAGLILFFAKFKGKRIKSLIAFWILVGVLPAALTRDGGNHATRLILILPSLVLLISYGLVEGVKLLKRNYRKFAAIAYGAAFFVSAAFFVHSYFVDSPWNSERWWHTGYKEAIQSIRGMEGGYEKVVLSTYSEPPWIFFAAYYPYPPDKWHEGYPFKKVEVPGFGNVSYIDKFYFGTIDAKEGMYSFGKFLNKHILYLATANEVKVNLIQEPERVPGDIKLVKSIAYPSGDPAFYLFTGKRDD